LICLCGVARDVGWFEDLSGWSSVTWWGDDRKPRQKAMEPRVKDLIPRNIKPYES